LHAGWNFAARRASGHPVAVWTGLWVGSILLTPIVFGVLYGRIDSSPIVMRGIFYAVASGLIHTAYFGLLALAYEHGAISVVYPVARGSGIAMIGLFAWLLLKEDISQLGTAGILLISVGIFSLGRRQTGGNLKGFYLALAVGLSIVAYSLIDKIGVSCLHPVIYIWVTWTVAALVLSLYILPRFRNQLLHLIKAYGLYGLIIGGGSIVAYLMILFAFTSAPVSYVAAIREFAIVLGVVSGFVFLGERVTVQKIIGIAAILLGIILVKAA
jgi:drug/metabolite transporter (DMT)-like permease